MVSLDGEWSDPSMAEELTTAVRPGMLVLTRESRGMTQAEVAQAMSELAGEPISQASVSKAEAGRAPLIGKRLTWYAAAVRYPQRVLCEASEVSGVGIGLVHHRKKAALGAMALRRIHAELALARLQVRGLTAGQAADDAAAEAAQHRFGHIQVNDLDTPMDAARSLRRSWGLPPGPIADLVAVIEQAGGLILVRDLHTGDLDAVSQWDGVEAPLFLANDAAPGDRFRFSLSHEVGHIVMHPEPGATALQERQADQFASEFLMPVEDIRSELGGGLDLNRLLVLKQRWGVSMAALARRASSLAVISEWQYRNLMIEMSTLGYRTQEPGEVARERPRALHQMADGLVRDHDIEHTAAAAGLLLDEFSALYLPEAGHTNRLDLPSDLYTAHEVRR